ncbi:hypothetical protein SO802_006969 [Lithocarpus litseifolius]|uniref:Reverse transcriptase domain-containing protein n=1 Tax=Lithocarpus litseifolius TaxID=425828 RepID=A0AAW2DN67_9ROSI
MCSFAEEEIVLSLSKLLAGIACNIIILSRLLLVSKSFPSSSTIFASSGVFYQVGQFPSQALNSVAENYFQDLFTLVNPTDMGSVLDVVDKRFTSEMNDSLLQRYTAEEVRHALFQMHPSKSLGPDGMSPFFFQKFWNIVGDDVMANRLKLVLPNVISEAQSAFVPNRLITDNTTVAYEILHRMRNKRKGKVGQMAVKLDISKAYDWVEWGFLRSIILKLGLDCRWVDMAMETVTKTSYSILINGEPLSPYLYLLCMEGLSSLLRKAEESRALKGVLSSQQGVCISHLLFADDTMLFCQATVEEGQRLLALLGKYEAASGQAINRQKTTLFFSKNTRREVRNDIQQMLGARIMSECEKYLGLPMPNGKSKMGTFKELHVKITKRVLGWKEKLISKAGHEILIKTVAQAIPTYSMSLFKLPKSICDNINSLVARYWWGQNQEERKIHWINWRKLCTSKKKGGMGFRDLHAFNLAMLAKQAWRLIPNNGSLFYRVYKAWYFPNTSFLEAELGHNPSFLWRSLLAARDIIHARSHWTIGDGRSISVTSSSWLPYSPGFLITPSQGMKVADLIDNDSRQWDRGKLSTTFDRRTYESILALPLNNQNSQDKLIWKENKAQRFSVSSAYQVALRLIHPNQAEHSLVQAHGSTWRKIWKLNVPPKVRNFIWRACSGCLPTRENLHKKRVSVEGKCEPYCHQCETICHVLWECPFTRNVWALFKGTLQKCSNETDDFFLLFKMLQ